jgi:spermidine synthase
MSHARRGSANPPVPSGVGRPVTLARAEGPRGQVVLRRRGEHVELIVNGAFAMDTVDPSTEVELARLALEQLARPASVLVGGLGLGFTARAVLADPRVERLDVVEIEGQLVAWAREGPDSGIVPELAGLEDDPRCRLWTADIVDVLAGRAEPSGPWDVILLDVDNGPGFLVHAANTRLYAADGLRAALAQVHAEGVVVIWSSHQARALLADLAVVAQDAGGSAEEVVLPVAREGRSLTYFLYLLRR